MNQDKPIGAEKYRVVVQWHEEDSCFIASAPELGNCNVRAPTMVEAIELCEKAIEKFIEALRKQGHSVPTPFALKRFSGKLSLRIDPTLHRNIALKAEIAGVSINEYIERRLRETS